MGSDMAREPDEPKAPLQPLQFLLACHGDRLKRLVHLRLSCHLQGWADDSDVIQKATPGISWRLNEYAADPKLTLYLWLLHVTGLKLAEIHRRPGHVHSRCPQPLPARHQTTERDPVEIPVSWSDDAGAWCPAVNKSIRPTASD
jgi:hypothetical protein